MGTLELHVLAEDEFHLLWLALDLVDGEAALEKVASLGHVVVASILNLHVHVDGPDVHSFGVVCDNAFEHRASALRLSILVLKRAELCDNVDVLGLGKSLKGPLEDCFRWCELVSVHSAPHFK